METVLVVEDDPIVRLHVCGALEDDGYAVLEAGCGDEAIRVITDNDPIDLVISDVKLPGTLNGLQLIQQIEDRWPSISTVVATGFSEAELQAPAGTTILRKPFGVSALLKACRAGLPQR